jgi:hypothetical protein
MSDWQNSYMPTYPSGMVVKFAVPRITLPHMLMRRRPRCPEPAFYRALAWYAQNLCDITFFSCDHFMRLGNHLVNFQTGDIYSGVNSDQSSGTGSDYDCDPTSGSSVSEPESIRSSGEQAVP